MKEEKTNKLHEGQVMDLASSNYLEDLRETARCAYRWNSFDPEARAEKPAASRPGRDSGREKAAVH